MRDRLQAAFAAVQAGQALKEKTMAAVYRRARRRQRARPLIGALACLVLLMGVGGGVFFTPVSAISLDVNPSIELKVNRFDRVVGVSAFNEEAEALAQTPHLLFADYAQALRTLLASPALQGYLEQGEVLSLFVACDDAQRSEKMLTAVKHCAGKGRNIHCRMGGWDEAAAHSAGLSCGKYQAFLELQALDPTVTPEAAQDMTMREIRERIKAITGEEPASGPGGHGQGHGQGCGAGHGGCRGQGAHAACREG